VDDVRHDHPTFDGKTRYRCMLVGLDDASMRACTAAIMPLDAVKMRDVKEACAKLSEILPLIVVVAEDAPPAGMPELRELAGACGAEMVAVARPVDGPSLGLRILEALHKAESRRVPR
jgi:hypothetical protein